MKSAHIAFKNGNLTDAELLARESIAMRPSVYLPSWDTPEKLLEQIKEERDRQSGVERKEGFFGGMRRFIFGKEAPKEVPRDPKGNPLPPINDFTPDGPRLPPQDSKQAPEPMAPFQPALPLPGPPLPMPPGPGQPLPLPPPSQSLQLPLPPPMQSSQNFGPSQTAVRMSDQELPPPNRPADVVQTSGLNFPGTEDPATAEKHLLALEHMRDAMAAFQKGDLAAARRFATMALDLRVAMRPSEPNPTQPADRDRSP